MLDNWNIIITIISFPVAFCYSLCCHISKMNILCHVGLLPQCSKVELGDNLVLLFNNFLINDILLLLYKILTQNFTRLF